VAIEEELNRKGLKQDGSLVTIPVYWHIITPAAGGADVSSLIPAQMQVLNDAFSASGFTFQVERVRVIPNDDWFLATVASAEEAQMKATLRVGGPESLNIYTTNGDIYLDWATVPFDYKFFPSYDGVVLFYPTLPGTDLEFPFDEEPDGLISYNLGDTATHEVGHWLGLDHTFAAGGCSHPGPHQRHADRGGAAVPLHSARQLRRSAVPRARPHHQLHGLCRRRVHGGVHVGPVEANGQAVARVPRQESQELNIRGNRR
jgi:hypothetical protein